jgi:tRNA(Ile)-lysidine synthase
MSLHVAHVDHNLRPDSGEDAAFVAEVAHAWGLPFHLRSLPPGALAQGPTNQEAAARAARYAFFREVAGAVTAQGEAAQVVVAHTLDDQAETLLMKLLRGAGLDGLAGMRPLAWLPGEGPPVRLLRPFLSLPRGLLRQALSADRIPWREDPTNQQTHLTRNWLRHQVIPLLAERSPGLVTRLGQTATILAGEAQRVAELDQSALAGALRPPVAEGDGQPMIRPGVDLATWRGMDEATQRGVLRLLWQRLGQQADALGFDGVERLRHALATQEGQSGPHSLAGGYAWSLLGDRFVIHPEEEAPLTPEHPWLRPGTVQPLTMPGPGDGETLLHACGGWALVARPLSADHLPRDWQRNPDPWQALVDGDAAQEWLLSSPAPGMKLAPLGMDGQHKSLGNLFTDSKTPGFLRPGWPLLIDQQTGEILWVCGLRLGHPARITAATRHLLHLRWTRRKEPS